MQNCGKCQRKTEHSYLVDYGMYTEECINYIGHQQTDIHETHTFKPLGHIEKHICNRCINRSRILWITPFILLPLAILLLFFSVKNNPDGLGFARVSVILLWVPWAVTAYFSFRKKASIGKSIAWKLSKKKLTRTYFPNGNMTSHQQSSSQRSTSKKYIGRARSELKYWAKK